MLESLYDFVALALGVTKLVSLTNDVVELVKQRKFLRISPHPEMPAFPLLERKHLFFVSSPVWFHESSCINITAPRATGLIPTMLSQLNKQKSLFTNLPSLPLLTAPEKEEDVLKMTDVAGLTDLPKEAKKAMEGLSETKNLVCYIYYADFQDLEEIQQASAGEKVMKSEDLLLFNHPYNVRRQSRLERKTRRVRLE